MGSSDNCRAQLLAECLCFIALSGSQAAGALALTWFHVLGCPPSPCFNKTQSLYDFLSTEIKNPSEEKLAAPRLHCALGVPSAPAPAAMLALGLQGQGTSELLPRMAGMPKATSAHRAAGTGRKVARPALRPVPLHGAQPQGGQGRQKREEKGKKARCKVQGPCEQRSVHLIVTDGAGAGWHCCVGMLSHPCCQPSPSLMPGGRTRSPLTGEKENLPF